jgi:hypothetical protein
MRRIMGRSDQPWLAAQWPPNGHALGASPAHARVVARTLAVGAVIALLAATATVAGPVAASPGTVDTWTIPGCVVKLANTFVAAHGRTAARWHTEGTVTCTGSELDGQDRIDLVRDRIPVPNSFAQATCSLTSLALCAGLDETHDSTYHGPRANWQARLVLFIRGPLSLAAWKASPECVLDIPSFDTICTFVGRTTRR